LYDLSVLDSNGTKVFEKKGLTAKDSQDTQAVKFPAAGSYQLVLTITGIQAQPDQKSESPPPVDRTRNGIARGTVVVLGQTNETAPAQANNNSVTEQQPPPAQNQTAAVPAPAQANNNSVTEQQQQQQNQTAAAPAPEQNPFEQLGQAISNMFGGGK
jgi:hypothetical protein